MLYVQICDGLSRLPCVGANDRAHLLPWAQGPGLELAGLPPAVLHGGSRCKPRWSQEREHVCSPGSFSPTLLSVNLTSKHTPQCLLLIYLQAIIHHPVYLSKTFKEMGMEMG